MDGHTRREHCRRCGAPVDAFTDPETGLVVHLDTQQPPITEDLAAHRGHVFEWRGDRVGWVYQHNPTRTWRDIRLRHRCGHDQPR